MKFLYKPEVTLVNKMGTDLTVVNAARVSFDKSSELNSDGTLKDSDAKLINYLAKHNHWSPLAHITAQFRIKAPVFVARQLVKHQVGLVWNEVSRRYVDSEPEFFMPVWRKRANNVKQGSGAVFEVDHQCWFTDELDDVCEHSLSTYKNFIANGVAPEQARMVLPLNHATEWYWTGSVAAFARVCKLRLDTHTQKETQDVAAKIDEALKQAFPVSWAALMEN